MGNRPKIFVDLEKIAPTIPSPIAWADINGIILGCNDLICKAIGASSQKVLIGKTLYGLYPKDVADVIMKNIMQVVQEKREIEFEEKNVDINTGKSLWFLARRGPLYDDDGVTVVGTIVNSIEITDRKEKEQLSLENEKQKLELLEQEKFRKLVNQAADDVRSPLAILLILSQQCSGFTRDVVFETVEKMAHVTSIPLWWVDENSVVLGANKLDVQIIGGRDAKEFIGKTQYDYLPFETADQVFKHNNLVMQTKKVLSEEVSFRNFTNGQLKYFSTLKAPLYDNIGNVVGVLCATVDITAEKEAERLRIENEKHKTELQKQEKFRKLVDQAAHDVQSPLASLLILIQNCMGYTRKEVYETIEKFADIVPVPLYWLDENNVILGANKMDLKAIGGEAIVGEVVGNGKTPYDIFPYEMADIKVKHNNLVMRTGKILSQEEQIKDFTTGETKYFTEFKAPLYDDNGQIIGILATAVDITTEKNAEHLKRETEAQKSQLAEQEKFKKITDQVVHDIRSPLASLSMMLKAYDKDIPEKIRLPLRDVAINISDIANSLLSRYEKDEAKGGIEEQKPVMIALILSQLLSDKKHQYKEMNIKFTDEFSQKCIFTFIKVQPSVFKRMLSNLVNNAIEALEGKKGIIHIDLSMDGNKIKVVVQDNGKGMPKDIIDKILSNAPVATDKQDGHGIGLAQIREALEYNQGKLAIESKLGKGTKMILTFPVIEPPEWVAKDIKVNKGDTVVILDDDRSIHGAWDSRFKDHLSEIQVRHFLISSKVIDFINTFSEKDKILLLTDYELLKQDINGIDIIQKTNIKHAILVTSHHAEEELRNTAIKNGIKILPKQLAPDVPIEICEVNKMCTRVDKSKKVDIVVIDDDEILGNSMVLLFKNYNKTADKYPNPKRFLEKISQYDKNTKIFTDNSFGAYSISGIELAKQLYDKGFTKLYLFSGKDFEEGEIPDYLTLIPKTDIDGLVRLLGEDF